ncbi:MAG TPA: nickel pincer cofactor biosynthesis protein LarC [Candidatus Polarisedimenticolaceae bacterium]|nr:nickel pincer cofactor biosynthesis protein LarC [Candidatus Polarisedimenticolaceae bacterium]
MTRLLWIDATAGASGDMILGALVDLGASLPAIRRALAGLPLKGVRLARTKTVRGAVSATRVEVKVAGARRDDHHVHDHHGAGHGRGWKEIRKVIASGGLPPAVRDRALVVFRRLIEAEARAHGMEPDAVHLHEAGAADAIADVVGVCVALAALRVDRVVVSPVTTGSGTVRCAHGLYPVPGPATSHLLVGVPLTGAAADGERLTPTGAALLTSLASGYGGPPAMTLEAVGHGAGKHDFPDRPNVVRVLLGEAPAEAARPDAREVVVVEFTVDDATPQALAYAAERLFETGAREVFTAPVQMKKGRLGHLVTFLTDDDRFEAVTRVALAETTTLGLRFRREGRIELDRAVERVATPYGPIRVKAGTLGRDELHAWPEYDDCARAARRHGVSLSAVQQAALAARRRRGGRAR